MLAEQDGIDAWDAPSAPPPPPHMINVSSSTPHRSSKTAAKRPSGQQRKSGTATTASAAAASRPSAAHAADGSGLMAAVPTASTLPNLRTSTASTVGPFGHSSVSVPTATGKAATAKKKKSTGGTSRSSSTKAAKKPAKAAAGTKKAPAKPKAAKAAGSVRSASTSTSRVSKPKKAASRASSASAKSGASKTKKPKSTKAAGKAGSVAASSRSAKSKSSAKPRTSAAKATAGTAAGKTAKKATGKRTGSSVASSRRAGSIKVRRGAPMKKARASSRASSSGGRSSAKSKRSRGSSAGAKRRRVTKINVASLLDAVVEQEVDARHALEVEEEMERDGLQPVYNVLVMELVRTQVQQLNRRQSQFTATMELLKERGLRQSHLEGAEDAEEIIELLRGRMEGDAIKELQQLRADNTSLRERLEERTLEVDKKASEMELLRTQLARQITRREVEKDALRAEVQSSLQSSTLDVERMKKDLGHRVDIACSTFRTPKYDTAMRAMQELVAQVQREVQEHHDTLSKLILSIGAKDTFSKEDGDSMHTNLPTQYRASLRALDKDNILNILDVLSFQEGVVTTVGKALYVLEETGHKTSVM